MRMWMTDPAAMCDRHLLGEHVECHMLAGTLARRRSIAGFVDKRLLEPDSLVARHEELAREMGARGFRHLSPLEEPELGYLPASARGRVVDREASGAALRARCDACARRMTGR